MSIIKEILKKISNSAEKMVKEIERQELAKDIIPKKKGFLESRIVKHQTVDGEREVIELSDSACFVPVTTDGFYVLASQYRASVKATTLSIYGGYVDKGEVGIQTAVREMYEECNISKDKLTDHTCIYHRLSPSLGICTEKNSLYLLELNCTRAELNVKSNDENESITPVFVTKEDIANLELTGMKSYIFQQYIINTK